MKKIVLTALALALSTSVALADDKPSDEEVAKIKEAIASFNCEAGSTFEKETEGTGVYEAEDVKCKTGQFDFRLTKDFKVFAITAD